MIARDLHGTPGVDAPSVLVTASPTRGLDVGAIETVRSLLDQARARGAGVLLISEDLEEVLSLSDRVVVLYRGAIAYECRAEGARRESIGLAMAGVAP